MKKLTKLFAIVLTLFTCLALTLSVNAMSYEEFDDPEDFETQTFYQEDGDKWVESSQTVRTYDNKGNLIEEDFNDYIEGKFEPGSKNTYTYNDKNELIEEGQYVYMSNEYKLYENVVYTYVEGKVSTQSIYEYDSGEKLVRTYQYSYNEKGLESGYQCNVLDEESGQLIKQHTEAYEYNASGLVTKCTQLQFSKTGSVNYVNIDTHSYDEQGREIGKSYATGTKEDLSDQQVTTRYEITYSTTPEGRLKINELVYSVEGTTETLGRKSEIISSDDIKSTFYEVSYYGSPFEFGDHEKQLAFYDEKTGKLVKVERYEIDKDGKETLDGYWTYTYKVEKEPEPEPQPEPQPEKKSNVGLIIAIILGVIVLVVGGSFAGWIIEIKKKGQDAQRIFKFLDKIFSKIVKMN